MNLTTVQHPSYGDGATTYASRQETWMTNAEANEQAIQTRNELSNNLLVGTGVIAGSYTAPLLAIGAGLSVNVAAFSAFLGNPIQKTSTSIIGGLTPSTVNHLYLMQDGSYLSNTTGVSPGTLSNPATKLGTATTGVATVTSVDNTRTEIYLFGKGPREEQFALAWDADPDLRTGGALHAVTLSATPATGTLVEVYVDRARWVNGLDFTVSGAVVTFISGAYPILDEVVTVVSTPA